MSRVYLCGVDYAHEMEFGLAKIYYSIDQLKESTVCWSTCGIVEVLLDEFGHEVGHTWIEEQNLYGKTKAD